MAMRHGAWSRRQMAQGMAHGAWGMEHGVQGMGHGAWSMRHGAKALAMAIIMATGYSPGPDHRCPPPRHDLQRGPAPAAPWSASASRRAGHKQRGQAAHRAAGPTMAGTPLPRWPCRDPPRLEPTKGCLARITGSSHKCRMQGGGEAWLEALAQPLNTKTISREGLARITGSSL